MRVSFVLAILMVFLAGCHTGAGKEAGNMADESISFVIGDTIELGIGENAVCREEGIEIEVKDIVAEEIAPAPGDEESYPAGSGVTVDLVIRKGSDSEEISLTMLSEGYESKTSEIWKGYSITLIEASEKARLRIASDD
ncbi:hypothetical protein KY362_04170 [Candidatus Woesearchaeota archaeon]|nr:hypothetical protein [Candidatus Woesearchaeota archaeon]